VLELRLAGNRVDRGIDGGIDAAGARTVPSNAWARGLAPAQRRREMNAQGGAAQMLEISAMSRL